MQVLAVNRIGLTVLCEFANHLALCGEEEVDDADAAVEVMPREQASERKREGEVILSSIHACKGALRSSLLLQSS
jgi:hypothetical protein